MDREVGKEVLTVEGLSKTIDGVKVLNNVSFRIERTDKVAFVGENENSATALFKILMGEMEPDEGTFKWGNTTSQSYFPKDNTEYFAGCDEDRSAGCRSILRGISQRRILEDSWEECSFPGTRCTRMYRFCPEEKRCAACWRG